MWDSFITKSDLYNLRQGSSIVVPRATSTRSTNSFDVRVALAARVDLLSSHVHNPKNSGNR